MPEFGNSSAALVEVGLVRLGFGLGYGNFFVCDIFR